MSPPEQPTSPALLEPAAAGAGHRLPDQGVPIEQQRMLAFLIQNTEQGIWTIDNELRTTDANPAMCRMLGLTLQQLLGRTIYEFVDAENERIFREHVARRTLGEAEGYEIALRRADGSTVHCYNNATPILDAQGRKIGAVGMFSDISRLKQAEQQVRLTSALLAQKTQALENTLESLSQGVLGIDSGGRATAWNQRFLDLLKLPASLMAERPTLDRIRRYQVEHGLLEGVEQGMPPARPPEYQRVRADGVVLQVQTRTAADGSIVRTYSDVTARVQAQRALQESESRFRNMADAAPAFIWLAGANGEPQWFNQRWLERTGRAMAQELALPWSSRMHPEDLDRCRVLFRDAEVSRQPYVVEFRQLANDGSTPWLLDHGIPRFDVDGRFEGFIVYGWDITGRKAAESALIAAKEEAERANRAKSEFLSRMSHELRTPLNAVLGFGQLMQGDTSDPLSPLQRSRMLELLRGGRHLLSLIDDVLDLARIEAGRLNLALAPVLLAEVARESLGLVQAAAADRGIALVPDAASDPAIIVSADPTRLKQVLLNLLSNAIKYNSAGGRVELGWSRHGGEVIVEVRDTGPGLSAQQQARLFNAFERLDAAASDVEGLGLGLALSKWLVDLMRGRIGVRSTPGQGSVFWVALAGAGAPAEGPTVDAPPPAPAAVLARQGSTVLYVEDNEVNQLLMAGVLAQRPAVQLLLAALPQEGLAQALQARPDLILLDIQLPGFDGFEVLRRLRADPRTQAIPVVAVSANAMPADRQRALDAGFQAYVTKPIEIPSLLAVVDEMLAG